MNKVQDVNNWSECSFTFGLLFCVVCGVFALLSFIEPGPGDGVQKHESVMTKQIEEARSGDFIVLKNGEVIRIQMINSEFRTEGRHFDMTYDIRITSGGVYVYRKPLKEIASEAVAVVNPLDGNYYTVSKCFNDGKYVTTQGAERLTCGN